MQRCQILVLSALLLAFSWVAGAGHAQLLGGLTGESKASSDISDVIREATENGVGVIVIDTEGNVLTPTGRGDTGADSGGGTMMSGAGLMTAQESANAFRTALFQRLTKLPQDLAALRDVLRESSPDGTLMAYVMVLIGSLVLFGIGMIAQKYIYGRHIAAHFIMPLIRENPEGYSGKMPFLTARFTGQVIGIVFSMLVAYVLGFVVYGPIEDAAIQYTVTLINIAYFSARLVTAAWRMILSPFLTQYRIPRLSDEDARRLYYWLSTVVTVGFFTLIFGAWVRELGLNEDVYVFFTSLLSFLVMLLNILLVMVNRRAITNAILNGQQHRKVTWPVRLLAGFWAPFAILFLVFAWGELVYDLVIGNEPGIPLSAGAYVILTSILLVYGITNFLIERGFARARAMRALNVDGAEESADIAPAIVAASQSRISTFEDLARRIAAIIAFVVGGYAFLSFWEPDTNRMADSVPDRTLDIVVIMFIGYIVYSAFRIWIDAKILEEQGDEEPAELGDEGGGSSASRLATLLPLFRNVVLIVIIVTVALIILMEMGVNVGPLFAGAGIVGVAVGFGSQSLVRDIFSGAFFLFDDAFRKGEYIEIGEVRGTVENISVRSFQLRHHLGKLHTIPFGEIQVLTNYSRDWVMMKLPLRVTYDTDVERVRKLIKKLGLQLLEDPVIGQDFLQPLKSQGVVEMQDSAMILRVKFMTKPGDQWVIRKRVFQEIRELFEREGIKFAHREVTVRLADGSSPEEMSPQQKEAVMAAAQAAIDDDILDAMEDGGGDDR